VKRTPEEIKKIILEKAWADDRIRAVLLNGSRANGKIKPDAFQDFDIVYLVNEMESFLADHDWTSIFGEKRICQLPALMEIDDSDIKKRPLSFSYLMLFLDGNRIDLTLFPMEKMETDFVPDSLSVVWLDKDNLFTNLPAPDDRDYIIIQPTEKEFADVCNEFWWVCTYVSKGLARNEIVYAKAMMEKHVRQMFMQVVSWNIGAHSAFSVSLGNEGKYLQKYLTAKKYKLVLKTYAAFKRDKIWKALFRITDLFGEFAVELAGKLKYKYNWDEQIKTLEWLKEQYKNR
jgi:aminoglycoside 6-adenylyltransferase